ncbi:MAG: PD40 domain-containing protein [Bacteroidia bacterium]|nr:PD40 domain-containing protein [Bacteroidia bacterium]
MKKIFTISVLLSLIGLSGVAQEKIFFCKGTSTDRDIYMINPDGTGLLPVIQWSGSDERLPRISPDGTKLAFTSNKTGGIFQVWISNIDGTNAYQVTNVSIGAAWGFSWHPNGQYIFFDNAKGNEDSQVCKIKTDGTEFEILVDNIGYCEHDINSEINPVDSTKLLYMHDHCWNPTSSTFVYNLQTQSETMILNGSSLSKAHSSHRWSHDGTKILLFIRIYSGYGNNGYGLCLV